MSIGVKIGPKTGVRLSKSVTFSLLVLYTLQTGLTIFLVVDKFHKAELIREQERRIRELEERVKVLRIIEEFQIGFSQQEAVELANVIYDESRRYGCDPLLILALIKSESAFRRGSRSRRGAQGLMQIIPSTARWVAQRRGFEWDEENSPFEPALNIRIGMLYLLELILKFQDVKKAIIAYNLGENELALRIKKGEQLPSLYLKRVMDTYRTFQERG